MLKTIIGHEKLKERLSVRLEKFPLGTYLFHGPPSTGKRTTAFAAAKYILCEDNPILIRHTNRASYPCLYEERELPNSDVFILLM